MKKITKNKIELNKEVFNDKLDFEKTNINNSKNKAKSKTKKIDENTEKTFDMRRFDTQDLDLLSNSVRHGNNAHGKTDITSFDFKYYNNRKAHKSILVISIIMLMVVVALLLILIICRII